MSSFFFSIFLKPLWKRFKKIFIVFIIIFGFYTCFIVYSAVETFKNFDPHFLQEEANYIYDRNNVLIGFTSSRNRKYITIDETPEELKK